MPAFRRRWRRRRRITKWCDIVPVEVGQTTERVTPIQMTVYPIPPRSFWMANLPVLAVINRLIPYSVFSGLDPLIAHKGDDVAVTLSSDELSPFGNVILT
jgi:hypothetical protein